LFRLAIVWINASWVTNWPPEEEEYEDDEGDVNEIDLLRGLMGLETGGDLVRESGGDLGGDLVDLASFDFLDDDDEDAEDEEDPLAHEMYEEEESFTDEEEVCRWSTRSI